MTDIEIKPGQIWAWQDTYDARGPHGYLFEIVEASPDAPAVAYQYRDMPGYDSDRTITAPAEVVRANANLVRCVCRAGTEDVCNQHSATPAPLDPTTIRKGSKVFLEDGPEADANYVGGTVGHVNENGFVIIDHLGSFAVEGLTEARHAKNYRTFRLTKHQPAPEPEPEWKPGTTGTAEVVREGANGGPRMFRRTRGMVVHRPAPIDDVMFVTTEGDLWALEGNYCKDFVPDEPRPLPTRERISHVLGMEHLRGGTNGLIARQTDAVLALLDGAR